jgi:FtsP/CotA-like multicopper oxidase with cupredoxin domain
MAFIRHESSGFSTREIHTRRLVWIVAAGLVPLFLLDASIGAHAASDGPRREAASHHETPDPCVRPAGRTVADPPDLRSRDGLLNVDLAIHNHREADGSIRYCYTLADGTQAPTLRLHPGDQLVLRLTNALTDVGAKPAAGHGRMSGVRSGANRGPCGGGAMTALTTNLHFHGMTVPPVCRQDEVLKTLIQPGDAPFEYRLRVPDDEPPGLYWYHPHVHGFSAMEVAGGASGALIIEGIERANPQVAGMPERVLVIRDQPPINPRAPPAVAAGDRAASEGIPSGGADAASAPKVVYDREGDVVSTGTGFGMPARDVSINYVPVPYPDYPPASIAMKPGERQLWRVLNAASLTYLDLAVKFADVQQTLGIVAIDGVPINHAGGTAPSVAWLTHISLPPGSRAEFIVTGPPAGVPATLVTHWVDTGPGGENDPERTLASLTATDAAQPASTLPAAHDPLPPARLSWVGDAKPVRVRKLYFSEELSDPNDPASATAFFLSVDGQEPAAFDPNTHVPNIVVKQGDIEDWIIENRSYEAHAFHIHQLHFQVRDWGQKSINEPFLRDTINVPYYNPTMPSYPSVRLRMDFRDPNSVGTFVYHCHVLEHEDGGMMGTVRVEPAMGSDAAPAR